MMLDRDLAIRGHDVMQSISEVRESLKALTQSVSELSELEVPSEVIGMVLEHAVAVVENLQELYS